MTNNTELLPCPFCGGEAVERMWLPEGIGTGRAGCSTVGATSNLENCPLEDAEILIVKWNTRAALPEDVRAVVDEPVAWRCGGITWSYQADAMKHAERFSLVVEPLYRHPERPMVLPERSTGCGKSETIGHGSNAKCGQKFFGDDVYLCDGCKRENACLDRIAELNK